jgi:hypothetical protein
MMLKEAIVAYFKVLSRSLAGGTQENHEHLRVVGVQAEIRIKHLLNTSQMR